MLQFPCVLVLVHKWIVLLMSGDEEKEAEM